MLDRNNTGQTSTNTYTSGNPLLSTGELKQDVIGGTPKIIRKADPRRGNSQARVIDREMAIAPGMMKTGNTIL